MTGMYATVAVLAALAHRERTGTGQFIDLALLDVQVSALANMNLNYFCSGKTPPRMGNAHANLVPYQAFACSDGHLVVAAGNTNHFRQLCIALGMPELADDERFVANPGRVRNREALIAILEATFRTKTVKAWMDVLAQSEVPCAPINTIPQVFAEPQVKARELEIKVEHPLAGPISLVANPIRFSDASLTYAAPPLLAQHTDEVLGGLLGMSSDEVTALSAKGVVARRKA
jgi:formyl-CoA transferase